MKKGFTLVEVLLVIALITILFSIVIVAINPSRQFSQANNAQRRSDINAILNAISQYENDNRGSLPVGIAATTTKIIGSAASGCSMTCNGTTTAAACLNLYNDLVPRYLENIPFDPTSGSSANTLYAVYATSTSRVLVTACSPELSEVIAVSR